VNLHHHPDYEIEPVPGLPEPLPKGETLLWQGAPRWQATAIRVFHARKVAIYFGVLLAWRVAAGISDGLSAVEVAAGVTWLVGLGLAAVGLLTLFAWMSAKTTLYSVTDRRLVFRVGMALPVTVNLPFAAIASADLRLRRDGTGDIALAMAPPHKASYFLLWPHVRPWRITKAQPMLRGLPNAREAANILARALAAEAARAPLPAPAAAPAPVAAAAPTTATLVRAPRVRRQDQRVAV
jgi:hypothetical protein